MLRDRNLDNWQQPFETGSVTDFMIKPGTMLQHNWYKLQDFSQTDQFSCLQASFDSTIQCISFMYAPETDEKGAALIFI